MNSDNRTHYDADHTTETNEDNWEDDGLDYSEEINQLPLAARLGGMLCTNFAMLTSGDFSWDVIPASQIYQVVSNYAPDMADFRDRGISTEDLLSGIEIYKAIKSSAAPWALTLAQDFEADDSNFTVEMGSIFDVVVDEFISGVADDEDDLGHIAKTDPILYGEICLETTRLLTARQHA